MSEHTPITTELRETIRSLAIDDSVLTIGGDDFHRLCDAIDAVHAGLERENAELRERLAVLDESADSMHETDAWKLGYDEGFASAEDWMADNEDAMAEHGWVRLPKDADGEYIHAGDVLDGYGKTIEVVEMRYGRSGWVLISRDGNGYADTFAFSHYHAPTVEDVLTKFGIDWEYEDNCEDRAALLKEYAAKLRLASNEE